MDSVAKIDEPPLARTTEGERGPLFQLQNSSFNACKSTQSSISLVAQPRGATTSNNLVSFHQPRVGRATMP
jgi:hypothetical protein